MLKTLLRRIRARVDLFVRTHIVADEKDLWPGLTPLEINEIETASPNGDADRR